MVAHTILIISALAITFIAILMYYVIRAFASVGFTFSETLVVVFGSLVAFFYLPDIHLITYNNMNLMANIAGFLIPFLLSIRLIVTKRAPLIRSLVGIAIVGYLVQTNSEVSLEGVLVSNIPAIVLVSSLYSLASTRKYDEKGPIAYISGSMGVIIGADILNLTKISQTVPHEFSLIFGGAGVFDAIYLVGLFAILVDIIFSLAYRLYDDLGVDDVGSMNRSEKKLLNIIQNEIPVEQRPFKVIGEQINLSEKQVLQTIERLIDKGIIRRIGPIINPRAIGYVSTLVAMKVEPEDLDSVAESIGLFPEVTHNYARDGGYNLWFTITAKDEKRVQEILKKIEDVTGYKPYNLPAKRVFKIGVKFEFR
jgi:DNA-binding Lrp family transcriptional regulator/uncharacterized membrane protein